MSKYTKVTKKVTHTLLHTYKPEKHIQPYAQSKRLHCSTITLTRPYTITRTKIFTHTTSAQLADLLDITYLWKQCHIPVVTFYGDITGTGIAALQRRAIVLCYACLCPLYLNEGGYAFLTFICSSVDNNGSSLFLTANCITCTTRLNVYFLFFTKQI